MPRSLPIHRHLGIAARWPVGVALTSWRYLWRTTPLHRRELEGSLPADGWPVLPEDVSHEEVQSPESGTGPLFHRRYIARIRESELTATALMERLQSDPDRAAPSEFATFRKTVGQKGRMAAGDEYVVRMAGPWDGPVRVVVVSEHSFRLATLDGHLEAGQIQFEAREVDGRLEFLIESWARSRNRLVHLLYAHLRMAKEIQLHMWTSFSERVAELAGGRLTGGIDIETRRVELAGQRKLAELRRRGYNFDPSRSSEYTPSNGWHVDDLSRELPPEPPGPPTAGGSWEVARRLMLGYEFADPSLVHAFYDPDEPLEGRTMLLELRFHGLLRFETGTRVASVYDEERTRDGRPARVWGWAYRTLEGHLEQGQMDWQVWKWIDTGRVEFRIHAYSRRAPDRNLLVRLGFRIFGRREQLAFLHSTLERMVRLTDLALRNADPATVREAADELTARRGFSYDSAHQRLASRVLDH